MRVAVPKETAPGELRVGLVPETISKLREAGFYKEWQERFGADAWSLLEGAVGKLA